MAAVFSYTARGVKPEPSLGHADLVSEGAGHRVAVLSTGRVMCIGSNQCGQLGLGAAGAAATAWVEAQLPWSACSASSGQDFNVALSSDRLAVCSWGSPGSCLGRGTSAGQQGDPGPPQEVVGLPDKDPVVLLEAGTSCAFAVTESGLVYGWGRNGNGQLALGSIGGERKGAVLIKRLSGRGVRRIALGSKHGVAELAHGIEYWGQKICVGQHHQLDPAPPPDWHHAGVALPLQCLAAGAHWIAAVDANGDAWIWGPARSAERAALPGGERAVVAACADAVVVVLTESGELYDCSQPGRCFNLRDRSEVPLPPGLTPYGGSCAQAVVLLEQRSGVLSVHGKVLGGRMLHEQLCDVGITAESVVELLGAPPATIHAAPEGPFQVFVTAAGLGIPDPVAVEVAADATVGGLAARAAQQLGVAPRS